MNVRSPRKPLLSAFGTTAVIFETSMLAGFLGLLLALEVGLVALLENFDGPVVDGIDSTFESTSSLIISSMSCVAEILLGDNNNPPTSLLVPARHTRKPRMNKSSQRFYSRRAPRSFARNSLVLRQGRTQRSFQVPDRSYWCKRDGRANRRRHDLRNCHRCRPLLCIGRRRPRRG